MLETTATRPAGWKPEVTEPGRHAHRRRSLSRPLGVVMPSDRPGFLSEVIGPQAEPSLATLKPISPVFWTGRRIAASTAIFGLGLVSAIPDGARPNFSATEATIAAGGMQHVTDGSGRVDVPVAVLLPELKNHSIIAQPTLDSHVAERDARLAENGTASFGVSTVALPEGFAELMAGAQVLVPENSNVAVAGTQPGLKVTLDRRQGQPSRLHIEADKTAGQHTPDRLVLAIVPRQR